MKLSNKHTFTTKSPNYVFATLIFLLFCRLVSMYFVPLFDPSEARYAEIARKMLEMGDWVTPMYEYGVPFWAKPPLSFWLSALSMKLLGVNEFAARLPSFCLSLGILWLIWGIAKKHCGMVVAEVAILVLASSMAFLIDAGAMMTDPSLLFCTTLTMVSFWQTMIEKNQKWRYVFFLGLSLGLLAKGPLIMVLTGLPIFLWVLAYKKWRDLWTFLPWIKGGLFMLIIALPWYLLAESHTPGFLNYFIVGEHISRFSQSGWQGDKYGHAHSEPFGMIWIYTSIGILPWTFAVISWLMHHYKKIKFFCSDGGWTTYWLLSMLLPLIFFTFAKNIIWTYLLPCLPAFALLFGSFYSRTKISEQLRKSFPFVAAIPGFVVIVITLLYVFEPQIMLKSNKPVITLWKEQHPSSDSHLIYWSAESRRFFSWEFYSAGRLEVTSDSAKLTNLLENNQENYIITKYEQHLPLPRSVISRVREINTVQTGEGLFTLYRTERLSP